MTIIFSDIKHGAFLSDQFRLLITDPTGFSADLWSLLDASVLANELWHRIEWLRRHPEMGIGVDVKSLEAEWEAMRKDDGPPEGMRTEMEGMLKRIEGRIATETAENVLETGKTSPEAEKIHRNFHLAKLARMIYNNDQLASDWAERTKEEQIRAITVILGKYRILRYPCMITVFILI